MAGGLAGRAILVVGAGIGGLAAALALARRGARVRVIEQAPALTEVGAGLQIGPNAVAVLEALGVAEALAPLASAPPAVELRDFRHGALVARLPMGAAALARHGRPYWQFHRADLLGALAEAALAAGAGIETGARVTRVVQDGARVRVVTEAGEVAAEAVVAADGARSGIRAELFGGQPPRFTGNVAWRGLVAAERLPPDAVPVATRVTMGQGRHLVTYPLRGGSVVNFVAVEERAAWVAEGWSATDDPARLRAAFRGWHPGVEALLAAVTETFLWGLHDHAPLPDWNRGRVALLGDACHPMLPFLAQGAAMAIEDAWVLAACLDAAATVEVGLGDYGRRRLPRATRVQVAAARNGRIYHLGAPARAPAHLALRLVSRVAPGALLGRFDWLYGADVTGARVGAGSI